jgi:hypothetical protein
MPRDPELLPTSLGEIFTREEALANGLTLGRLRRRDLDRHVRGVRAAAGSASDFATRCQMFQRRLGPRIHFSHATAALLVGAPIPVTAISDVLHVTVAAPARAPHARGIVGHSRQIFPTDVVTTAGVRHSSPARMWCELGGLTIPDLVALGDALIQQPRPMASIADLSERLEMGDRITRSRRLRTALGLLDPRAESPQESRLRCLLALGGLPPADINHTLVASESGHDIRPDFTFARQRVILEYQGDYHRSRAQWRADMTRRSRLETDGWRVMELNADDLKNPRELCARIRRLLEPAKR